MMLIRSLEHLHHPFGAKPVFLMQTSLQALVW
jgi:hypothetical protein